MHKNDCLFLDCIYKGTHQKLIELKNYQRGELSEENFRFSIRNINNVEFSKGEEKYNKQFSGIRATIETKFADIGNIFLRFHSNNHFRVSDFNAQIKLCSFLRFFKNDE